MNSIQSPLSSHHSPSPRISSGLQFQDISHLPITYPSPSPSINHHQQQQQQREYEQSRAWLEGDYVDDDGEQSDEDDEWELDREYVDIAIADTYGGYDPVRPRPVQRDSDVEFGNRLSSMRSLRGRGRTSMRLPPMMHMKGLQRGKTALIRRLRGGFRRANIHGHLHHSSGSGHSPPFEFRDPQPAPASIRQQYAELAPPESAPGVADQAGGDRGSSEPATHEMKTENGLLAPPVTQNGPNPSLLLTTTSPAVDRRTSPTIPADANSHSERRHSRSRSAIYHSQSLPNPTHTTRPRSRSVGSHRSAGSSETVVVAPDARAQMYDDWRRNRDTEGQDDDEDEDTAETTLVQHVNDLTLTPIHLSPSKSPSKASGHSKLSLNTHRYSRPPDVRLPRSHTQARYHHSRTRSRLGRYTSKTKSSLVRAIQAFNRLPWMAASEDLRGALIPSDYYPTPRITKDFVPARSGLAKLRDSLPPSSGLVYKKENVSLQELENDEGYGSWYLPSRKQLQRNVRAQYYRDQQRARVLGANVGVEGLGGNIARPVKQVYATYRTVAGRSERPLDYMYAPIASGSVVAPSLYSTGRLSHANYDGRHHTRREGTTSVTRSRSATGSVDMEVGAALYGVGSRPGSIAAAASAYLTRSASTSQAGSFAGSQSGRQTAVEYAANGGTSMPPPPESTSGHAGLQVSRSPPQAQNQSQNQQLQQQYPMYAYAYTYPTTHSQTQGQAAQYYAYNSAYPQLQSQSYSRTRVPGSSPPLPPIPVAASTATSGYTESGNIPTIPSIIDHSASTGSSQVAEYSYTRPHEHRHRDRHGYEHQHRREYDDGYWSGRSYSHEREREHGYGDRHRHHREPASGGGYFGRSVSGFSSGSSSSTDSGYVTTGSAPVGTNSGRYADYAYSSYIR